jgi:hypothetical protein
MSADLFMDPEHYAMVEAAIDRNRCYSRFELARLVIRTVLGIEDTEIVHVWCDRFNRTVVDLKSLESYHFSYELIG